MTPRVGRSGIYPAAGKIRCIRREEEGGGGGEGGEGGTEKNGKKPEKYLSSSVSEKN